MRLEAGGGTEENDAQLVNAADVDAAGCDASGGDEDGDLPAADVIIRRTSK